MGIPPRSWWKTFANDLWRKIDKDNVFNGAAALAFFLLLAIFPGAIFILALLPHLSIPHIQQAIFDLLSQVLPVQSATLFEQTVHAAAAEQKGGLLKFGLLFFLWSASAGVYALIQQLNVASEANDQRPFWKVRGTAILLMLFFVLLVITSLSLVILGGLVQAWLASLIGWRPALLIVFATSRWIIIGITLLLTLSVIYSVGPDVEIKFRLLSPGSIVGAALIVLTSIGFRFYIAIFGNFSSTYGNLAAMIVLMLWLYLASVALLVGFEINTILHLD
jgi:membrane protein